MDNQRMLQAMFVEATIGIIVVNGQGEIVQANPFAEKLFGYEKGELISNPIEILIPNSFRTHHVEYRKKYHQKPIPRTMGANLDLHGQRKDGSLFSIEISLSHMDIDGERFAIAYASDDTLQQETLKSLKEAKKISDDISNIVEESLSEIFIFDGETLKFIQVNKGARQNMGYSLEEMQTMTPIDLKPDFEEKEFLELIEPLKDGRENKLLFETLHLRKDGTTYPIEVHLQYSRLGTQPVFVAFISDVSQRKEYEHKILMHSEELEKKVIERTEELRASESKLRESYEKEKQLGELKSRFVSMASHEFRTPLSSILSSANLIGRYEKGEQHDKRMKHVNRIESSVRNLTSILNDFLSLEKLESGKVRYHPVEIEIEEYIQHVIDEMSLILKSDQKIIHIHEGDKQVVADEHLLKNIMINLLSNGIKYSPAGKNVELHTKYDEGKINIQVKDYGIGIPEADQRLMFTRFFRAHNVTNIQGTGLGLTIVKRYLNLMGGKIWFESKEGEGTTFFVEIPNVKNDN
ncbi:MAG: PAS domain S-box protein [Saprospiraceae bacterium]